MPVQAAPAIPFVDLTAQYRSIQPEIDAAIQRVLDRGTFVLGPEVEALESELARYLGVSRTVTVASGTDALELVLRALGIGPGDEVLTTAFSFFATAQAIATVGATPMFLDIELETYNLDVSQLEARRTPKTKAILPVHLYGHPCDMDAVMAFASRHQLPVIEDCAQAIGARFRGRKVGSFGTAACFSFYPTKNLGAYGDGGMVATSDEKLADQIRLLRMHGSRDRIRHEVLSRNSRLDELQAAILRAKLPHLESWNQARRRHAAAYRTLLGQVTDLVLPEERPGCEHVYHLFAVRSPERERLRQALQQKGIATQVHYGLPLLAQPALAAQAAGAPVCPNAMCIAKEVFSLPMYPELTPAQIETVARALVGSPAAQPA